MTRIGLIVFCLLFSLQASAATFTISSQEPTRREDADVNNRDGGITSAISEERSLTDALRSRSNTDEIVKVAAYADTLPRRILAFWDSINDHLVENSLVHKTIEMPLNYLGLDVIYHDIQKPLPDLAQRHDILGIVVCFSDSTNMPNPKEFIDWTVDAINKGKKIVLMENLGFWSNTKGVYTSGDVTNLLFEKMGFNNSQKWIEYPFDYRILVQEKELFPFERDYPLPLPGFNINRAFDKTAKSYLKIGVPGKPETETDLVIIGPHGGFAAQYYANSFDDVLFTSNPRALGWYLNPFRFFELAFGLSLSPIPDPTTLAGRRIFFATCHGDDWNATTSIEEYANKDVYCSEVLLEKVIKPHPDIPTAVGIVAANIDPSWVARTKSQEIARNYLATPCVEAASHTYSHPFYWDFFETGGPEKEIDYLYLYPYGSWQNSFLSWLHGKYEQAFTTHIQVMSEQGVTQIVGKNKLPWGYTIPRAYANEPFNLKKEIIGAADYIDQFAPQTNQVKLLIWPGDSRPWAQAVALAYQDGLQNQGGGYVRFDSGHPSILFVYPLARKPGGWIQLYSVANGDNDYTNEWQDHFYAFQFLPETLKNTGAPRRLKPIQLYYHSFSGENLEGVNAILSNISFVRSQQIIPIQVKRYCEIGAGFFSAELQPLGKDKWKIHNRQGLQTLRFDHAEKYSINFSDSLGVIGYNHYQGSLYAYLDASEAAPIIALTTSAVNDTPYLIESNWEITELKRNGDKMSFNAQGWGKTFMKWKLPSTGSYVVKAPPSTRQTIQTSKDGILIIALDLPYNKKIAISVERSEK